MDKRLKNKVKLIGNLYNIPTKEIINGKSAYKITLDTKGLVDCYLYSDEKEFSKCDIGTRIIIQGHLESSEGNPIVIIDLYRVIKLESGN